MTRTVKSTIKIGRAVREHDLGDRREEEILDWNSILPVISQEYNGEKKIHAGDPVDPKFIACYPGWGRRGCTARGHRQGIEEGVSRGLGTSVRPPACPP